MMEKQLIGEVEICNNPIDGRLVVRHFADGASVIVRIP